MYDPTVGRWLGEDPIGFEGRQANTSVYCGNDPVNHSDPSGLSQLSEALKAKVKEIKNDAVKGIIDNLDTNGWDVTYLDNGLFTLSKTISDGNGNSTHVTIWAEGKLRDPKLLSVDIYASGKTVNGRLTYQDGILKGHLEYGDGTTKPKTKVDVNVNTQTGASTVKVDGTLTLAGIGLYLAGGTVVVYPGGGKAPTTIANINADIKVHGTGGAAHISGGVKYEDGGWKANGEVMVVGMFLGANFQVSAGAETDLKTPDYYITVRVEKRF